MDTLDDHDLKILELIQDDATLTSAAIANAVALSPTACQRRIKRLRKEGVIEREAAILNPAAIGQRLSFVVQANLVRGQLNLVDGFKRQLRDTPQVQQCYYVTGEFSFVLVVVVRDVPEYEGLVRRLFLENPNVHKFQTSMVMDRVKATLSISLDDQRS